MIEKSINFTATNSLETQYIVPNDFIFRVRTISVANTVASTSGLTLRDDGTTRIKIELPADSSVTVSGLNIDFATNVQSLGDGTGIIATLCGELV